MADETTLILMRREQEAVADTRKMAEELKSLRAALAGTVEAWDRWYPKLSVCTEAEDDEFGVIQTARNLLRSAAS